jgi:hypothetical protein
MSTAAIMKHVDRMNENVVKNKMKRSEAKTNKKRAEVNCA